MYVCVNEYRCMHRDMEVVDLLAAAGFKKFSMFMV